MNDVCAYAVLQVPSTRTRNVVQEGRRRHCAVTAFNCWCRYRQQSASGPGGGVVIAADYTPGWVAPCFRPGMTGDASVDLPEARDTTLLVFSNCSTCLAVDRGWQRGS